MFKQPITILQLHKAESDVIRYKLLHVYIYFFHNKMTNDYLALKVIKKCNYRECGATKA